ncbi:NAD(P)-binding domain-containing protein [Actibacterium sp.]|uniref:NAD(P)-binding domain-containing protein n=1 Tax=Actibacterium sp. TaxID=1872125 RepID=UPI003563ED7C
MDTIVIGAGQAGLSVSHELTQRGVSHVVLERGQIGESWRRRWDNFCLVTPNWATRLPGFPYAGDDPDGYMPRDQVVAHLEAYADSFGAPVSTGVQITSVSKDGDGFHIQTDQGDYSCANLVVSTGAFQKPFLPKGAETLPEGLATLTLHDYHNPESLPDGDVLIIGSGQSGCQIAEELNEAGRKVTLACGRVAWAPRSFGGKDLFWWVVESGFADQKFSDVPPAARLAGNVLASGHHGGHDVNLALIQAQGVELVGRFTGAEGDTARFADNLDECNDFSNARYADLQAFFTPTAKAQDIQIDYPAPCHLTGSARTEIDLTEFGSVLFTGGFRPDYRSWLPWDDAFDDDGFARHTNGKSDTVEGLWFVGLHFLRTRKSALLVGVGEDAIAVAEQIAG